MRILNTLGNMPHPVATLFLTEESANRFAARHPQEGVDDPPSDFYPIVVECRSVEELDACVANDPDVDKQLLADKKTERIYLTAIGQPGRIRIEGSGEEDEKTIDLIQTTEGRSIIYFVEIVRQKENIRGKEGEGIDEARATD